MEWAWSARACQVKAVTRAIPRAFDTNSRLEVIMAFLDCISLLLIYKATSSLGPSEAIPLKKSPPFRLYLGSAAVNEQFDTSDETRIIRSEKQRRLSNFLGLP